jgi:hypothetical protein
MRAHLIGGAAAQFGDRRDDRLVAIAVEDFDQPWRPTVSAAACALMSPMRWSATRMFDEMMAWISGSSMPFLNSFTGGRRSPSCSTAVADAEKPPGTAPPVSGQWPVFDSQQKILPSR